MSFIDDNDMKSIRIVALSILAIFVLSLIVLYFGSPILAFGSKNVSFLYSVVVFIPVALICVYAMVRRS